MWDLLDDNDQKILANFVRACTLLVCRIINIDILREAHYRLLKVAKLIEENYGPERITPNIHLSFILLIIAIIMNYCILSGIIHLKK